MATVTLAVDTVRDTDRDTVSTKYGVEASFLIVIPSVCASVSGQCKPVLPVPSSKFRVGNSYEFPTRFFSGLICDDAMCWGCRNSGLE